jgi:predicted MPP superfamily phosphohydrolase
MAAGAAGLAAWGLWEAQWLETCVREVPVAGLPRSLDGLGILHLSDFHAGTPSLNMRTLQAAVDFGVSTGPDLVAITGDLVSHPRAVPQVARELARLKPPLGMYAVTGNHEVGDTSDPLSQGMVVDDWRPAAVELLRDRMVAVQRDGVRIEVAGLDADVTAFHPPPESLFDASTGALRVLLTHFPDVAERLPGGAASLVLAGHLHGGQICLPGPHGLIKLSHGDRRFDEGVFQNGSTTVVVSRGTGTTLVPFRFLCRPEVSLLKLRPA